MGVTRRLGLVFEISKKKTLIGSWWRQIVLAATFGRFTHFFTLNFSKVGNQSSPYQVPVTGFCEYIET